MQSKVWAEATYEIVSQVKGQKMADKQTIMVECDLGVLVDNMFNFDQFKTVLLAAVESSIKIKASERFIHRLKTETALKRSIGGTRWGIRLVGDIEQMPLYVRESKIGDFFQFLRGKKVARWDAEKKIQVFGVIYPDLLSKITDRNMALINSLYNQSLTAAANDAVDVPNLPLEEEIKKAA